jgi:hypothetical protein
MPTIKIMKKLLLLLLYVTFFVTANGQTRYTEAMQQGDSAFKNGQYKLAIDKYFAAQAFDPAKKNVVKEKMKLTFDKIEALREEAITLKQEAEQALKEKQRQKEIADSIVQILQQLKTTGIGAKYQGGIVFYWNDSTGKHGLIAAEIDLGEFKWQEAKDTCNRLDLNGYTDWRLPATEELSALYANRNVVGDFALSNYWSSTEINEGLAYSQSFKYGLENNYHSKTKRLRVRPVRSF